MNGVPTAISSTDIPIEQKIAAFAATVVPGAADAETAGLIATNAQLASQNTALETRIATAEASLTASQVEVGRLQGQVAVLDKSCKELTAENASLRHRAEVSQTETGRVNAEKNRINNRISKSCIKLGCITDFRDKDGNVLPSTAAAVEREAAADLIKPEDKLNLMEGAINIAMNKLSLPAGDLPGSTTQNADAPKKLTATEKCKAAVSAGKK